MSTRIRLRRMGSNKKPFFRIVVADARRPNGGLFLEQLGWYDPKRKGENFQLDLDRVEFWKQRGADVSDTVTSLVRKLRRKPATAAAAAPIADPTVAQA